MRARVLHVTPYFAPAFRYGGPPRSVLGLCRGLRRLGVDVQVFTTSANGDVELSPEITERRTFQDVPVRYFPRRFPRRSFGAAGLREALSQAVASVDLVHLHGLWNVPVWLAAGLCLQKKVPYVVSPRGMLDSGSFAHRRIRKELCYRLWERRYLSRAIFLHATSELEWKSLSERGLAPSIVQLPNGVTPPSETPARLNREQLGLGREDRLVVFMGRLHPAKRLDLLIQAAARARSSEPAVRLVIAGVPDGIDPRDLERANGAVIYVGVLDETQKWGLLRDADVVVCASSSESFGLSIVEAMLMGTPVVATRTCPWREIETHRCGFWVEQSTDAVAAAILDVLRDREQARAMGMRGRELATRRYSWPSICEEMAARYETVLGATP